MGRLDEAVAAMRQGRWAEAEARIDPDAEGELRGRALGLRGQCRLMLGRAAEARPDLLAAIRAAKAEGDADSVAQLRALHDQAAALLAAAKAPLDARDERVLRAQRERDPVLARALLDEAVSVRDRVIALLLLAELGDPTCLSTARDLADEADEPQLLAAVAQAAKRLGARVG